MAKKPEKKEVETTGHSWDGIQEYNNPLPRWWVWIFYATIIWGIGYSIAYPAWPGIKNSTAGLLGWSTRGQVAERIAEVEKMNAPKNDKLASVELASVSNDSDLYGYAVSSGAAVFRTWCAQCHGSGAAGANGYPNLIDNDWLWGGSLDDIHYTVTHGIRNETDPEEEARSGDMPAWGDMLEPEEIDQVINHVLKISGNDEADMALAEAGATVFADNCASCHGDDGKGMREVGAPNLTDAIWLYGGDKATITESVIKGRHGLMPNWNSRLSEAQIRAVSLYVHQLGGGE